MESEVALREAADDDAEELALLMRRVRAEAMPYLPVRHTPEQDRAFLEGVLRDREVWVAETPAEIVGFIAFTVAEIEHLYVDAEYRGEGVGTTLLGWAMRDDAPRELWVFARNADAIGFYEANGFTIVGRTDGAANEEREPDVRMRSSGGA